MNIFSHYSNAEQYKLIVPKRYIYNKRYNNMFNELLQLQEQLQD